MGFRRGRRANIKEKEQDIPDVDIQWTRLVAYLRPYVLRMLVAIVALVISASLSLVFPAVIGGVGEIPGVLDTVLQGGNLQILNMITLGLLVVFLVRSLTTFIETYNLNYIGERIVVDVRKELYDQLHKLSLDFYAERRVGEIISRLSSDVTYIRNVLTSNVTTLLQQLLVMIGSVAIMLFINWRLSAFIIVLIPVIMLVAVTFGTYLRRITTRIQDEIAFASIVAEESFQNVREVKSFARETFEVNRYNSAIDKAFNATIGRLRVSAAFTSTVAFLGFGGIALILWFGGREVLQGRLSAGELIAFLIYGLTVAGSFASLINLYSSVQEALGAMKRIFQIMELVPQISDKDDAQALPRIDGRIEFDNVTFSYDDKQDVLKHIQLDIAAGEIIALVGPSGAGKTTTLNLIPRFWDVTAGALRIDGIDVRDVTQSSLRSQVGIVPQETLLFGGTIRENILYGRLEATEDDLIAAARAANAHEFIANLPDGYETVVGERGIRLSGGQRQRVAIARAILKNPRILLLDEATSSLDNESEHLVQEALTRLMQDRTTLIIAHRLSTVRIAHRIVVMNAGEIVELGTHEDLLARDGLYAKLYDMQFRRDDLIGAD
jgi:ATP-binding cassette, subfamily B, bacterial MsbA